MRGWLSRASPTAFSTYAIVAAFSAYFCMYGFRKPFAAAEFAGEGAWGLHLKATLVLSQIVGYTLSKFLGVKLVTELAAGRRVVVLVGLIVFAELSLLAFGLLPPALRPLALFCNGLPLGAVWGLVYGFLEGRRTSEILGAGLSASYIVASGAVKSVGSAMLGWGVPEVWMPFLTGLVFLPPFGVAVWMLSRLPPPDLDDEAARTHRQPMTGAERRAFFMRFGLGLTVLTGLYMLLTAYRDFRDNFSAEIWRAVGQSGKPELFTLTEVPVALAVMAGLALLYRIRDNRRALLAVHVVMAGGAVSIGVATLLFDLGVLGPVWWMVLIGTGLYLAYVPYGCMLFDRLIAATGAVGTAVFMIYVTDAFGYAGSIAVLLYKLVGQAELSWLAFFRGFSYVTAVACTGAFVVSAWYFGRRVREGKGFG
ncbi:DUF5690 family protein [Paraliomyxa miuraensis]|uniref:DUF5690 family protein n=1 Tax=Paraliomyxa miuraensis TaxID=376150 RepID=UPI00225C2CBF|nr:DUF5690 family protein [Paraliomyxa miuraensis]MCX4247312.1 DUF5690 family protein [Paraliomyxa miuraensis]